MISRLSIFAFLSFSLLSCQETILEDSFTTNNTNLQIEETILERDPNFPWKPVINTKSKSISRSAIQLFHSDYLGFSYRTSLFPIEDTRNIGHRVIDIAKLSRDIPSYINTWKNKNHEANFFCIY